MIQQALELQEAMDTELHPVCTMCKGTGLVTRVSFSRPGEMLEKTCNICNGRRWMYLPASELTQFLVTLRKVIIGGTA